ncbi:glycoside hydrolase family 16 protein [Conidiobolus coronatus NRRL 28638]|uniref:Glycoside hydrolase family 16 protein n=1 Tax=Conidiobolus coronatus (strain ATCC 28846 / CBS 209.66 / NRRL 28638) TaxID=796925 RepID=A0A137P7A6_CONC2|nr:glycoside hydrolase family 16 protein [Conidiobolus coronatus NRRL 28638]|eukprot:KXN70811.1 glycoside hydrolase family 16 protein [Conidiobolus coronatus NRRL 28638]
MIKHNANNGGGDYAKLVWSDEFNGSQLDLSKWKMDVNCLGGGNNEQQCYVDNTDTEVISVKDGKLRIQPQYRENEWKMASSARLNSLGPNGGAWHRGKFVIKAKMPKGNFVWPSVWMLPKVSKYGGWPSDGEIDIIEAKGQNENVVNHNLHHGGPWRVEHVQYVPVQSSADMFHEYVLVWTDNKMEWSVDGVITHTMGLNDTWVHGQNTNIYSAPGQPWTEPFYLIVNVAVGGDFFGGAKMNPEYDAPTWTSPLEIDYIRVYQ